MRDVELTRRDRARLNGTVNTAATANLTVYTLQTAATPVYTACALQLGASTLSPFTTTYASFLRRRPSGRLVRGLTMDRHVRALR